MLLDINKIKVHDRARKTFSNIDKLAESIKENGLIHPPTITPDFDLIAGERRLRACKQLGYQQIEVRVMTVSDDAHHLKLERDENDNREAFTFSEAVELGRRIEEIEKYKAKDRQESGVVQNFAEGRTRDKVAEQVGFGSGEQFRKAKFISDNADEATIQQLDENQISIHAAYQKLKKQFKETETERVRLENESVHFRQLLNQERNKPQQVRQVKVEVLPSDYQDLKTQAIAGQKLNTENVRLQRQLQQMKEDTTRENEAASNCKKLKESLKNLLSIVNQEHYNAKFYFDQVAGSLQTFQIVQDFQHEFNEMITTVLLDWKDRTDLNPI